MAEERKNALTVNERVRDLRKRRKVQGIVKVEVYVYKEYKEKIKAYAKELNDQHEA